MLNFFKLHELKIILILAGIFFLLAFTSNFLWQPPDETSELAWSFLHGKMYFLDQIKNPDLINFNGHYYWVLPPLPAILMIPLVAIFQKPISFSLITFALNLALFGLIWRLANKIFKFCLTDSLWLSLLYLFASIYVSATMIATAYFVAHTLATILFILSLLEYYGKKRYWLIGSLLGLIFLSRFMAGLAVIFYLLLIIFSNEQLKIKIKQLLQLGAPILLAGLLLLGYNFIRFGNIFESGYQLTNFYQHFFYYRQHGFFSLYYIPSNFYYYFLETFIPFYATIPAGQPLYLLSAPYFSLNPWGAGSFFLISPIFVLIYKANLKIKEVKYALIVAGLILFLLLCYFYIGFFPQVGGRYLNDFLPLLFLVLLYILQNTGLKFRHKIIITLSALLNLYLYFLLLALFY